MLIKKFETEADWLNERLGRITGSRLGSIVTKRGTGKKIEFYQLIAERLGLPPDEENPMERGHRLEAEAIALFSEKTGKKVDTDLQIWFADWNDRVALSPDGAIGKTEAVEVKCLGSARHIEAVLTDSIPKDYEYQVLQYFIVNDKLKKLHFVFYDPRLRVKSYHVIEVKREDLEEQIAAMTEYQKVTLAEVDEAVSQLSGF
jgi:predicted phage-related endonuclease